MTYAVWPIEMTNWGPDDNSHGQTVDKKEITSCGTMASLYLQFSPKNDHSKEKNDGMLGYIFVFNNVSCIKIYH